MCISLHLYIKLGNHHAYHVMRVTVLCERKMEATLQPIAIGPLGIIPLITPISEPFRRWFRNPQHTLKNYLEAAFHFSTIYEQKFPQSPLDLVYLVYRCTVVGPDSTSPAGLSLVLRSQFRARYTYMK